MNKFTRRTFVKRTGAATLGTALGLGILPSLTRKLHAEDTSGSSSKQGVEILAGDTSDVTTYSVNGGTLTISQTLSASAPVDACVPSLQVTRVYEFDYTKIIDKVTYNGHVTLRVQRYYKCIGGVPTLTYAYGNNIGPVAITNGTTAIGTLDPGVNDGNDGQSGAGKARMIFQDEGEWTEWYEGANLPYQVLCCQLA